MPAPKPCTGTRNIAALILATVFSASCGGEEPDDPDDNVGSPPAVSDGTVAQSEAELRYRLKPRRGVRVTPTPNTPAPTTGSGGVTGAADAVAPGGATGSSEPVGPDGVIAVTNGGICPANAALPEGAACGPYGITCTFQTASATHYCTCLNASATGKQGWACR